MFERGDLTALLEAKADPAISIFLPTHVAGPGIRQDPIRLKNLLAATAERLAAHGRRRRDIADLLAPAHALLDDPIFWRHQSDGLALFIARGRFNRFKVPLALAEKAVTATRFHVKPLLPLFADDGRFFLLAVTKAEVRLFEGSRHRLEERFPDDMPDGLSEVIGEIDYESAVHFHPTGTADTTAGMPSARYHALGQSPDEVREAAMLRFLQRLDAAVTRHLAPHEAPLVVAADERVFGHFREISKYRRLVRDGIVANPGAMSAEDLHERAYAIVRSRFRRARDVAVERYRALEGDGGGRVASGIGEVVRDAEAGRVETLFVAEDVECWGRYDPATKQAECHDSPEAMDDDLLDLAAARALDTGAEVYVVPAAEVPARSPAAAILRY